MIDLSKYKIHDLTHSYSELIDGFAAKPARTLEEDGWNAKWLTIYSHAGTHMDAPFHFGVNNQTIDVFQPKDLMGKAWIAQVTITHQKQVIKLTDLGELTDKIAAGDSLLIKTNWNKKINEPFYKAGLPRIGEALAYWCVSKKIKILGVEPPSVADVSDLEEVTRIHHILLGGGVIIVEGLKNLDLIKKNQVFLVALPIKIKNGDGAPARVIAFEEII